MELNFTVSKQETATKIKTKVKAAMTEWIMAKLAEEFGEDAVAIVRNGKVNEIAVMVGSCEDGTDVNPIVVTIDPITKDCTTYATDRRKHVPYDFAAAKDTYEKYLAGKEAKAIANAEVKAANIKMHTAMREAKAKAKES